jgi:crotonobetainyl-CoA:carnitine CoA-transferase CaiB-like acyl-CoA transferase
VEHAAYGAVLQREGNRGPLAAPQNLYLASDAGEDGSRDTWVAVAVADDDQWQGLRRALGEPAWATDRSLDDHEGRRARHDDIDEQLGAWCAERRADDIVELLWEAGVPVAKVVQPHDQADLPPFQHRGFFESVDHPVAGTARHSTLPFRSSRGPERYHRRHAPLLGEHTEEVLRSLGVSDADLERLEADGVIGTAPAAAKASK